MRSTLPTAKILIVDDFADFRLSVKYMLQQLGAQSIEQAKCGEDALLKAKDTPFDLILCDYNLGDEQDGQQILEELHHTHRLKPGAIFVMVTAETSAAKVLGAIEYQPDAYLTKPFTQEQLAQRLTRLFAKNKALSPIFSALCKEQYPVALEACDDIAQRLPAVRFATLRIKASILKTLGQKREALEQIEDVLAQQPVLWAMLMRGELLFEEKNFAEARSQFEQTNDAFPSQAVVIDWMARCHRALGNQSQAEELLSAAIKLSPKSVRRQSELGEVAESLQHHEVAQKAFGTAIREGTYSCMIRPDHFQHYFDNTSALVEERSGRERTQLLASADHMYQKLERRYRREPNALAANQAAIARLHFQANQTDKAAAFLRKLSKTLEKPGCSLDQDQHNYIQEVLGPLAEEKHLANIINSISLPTVGSSTTKKQKQKQEQESDSPEAKKFNREGMRYAEEKRPLDALNLFGRALEIAPNHPSYLLNIIQVVSENALLAEDPAILAAARAHLLELDKLPSSDQRYQRYQALKKRFDREL